MLVLPEMLLVKGTGELYAGSHNLIEDGLLRIEVVLLFQEGDLDVLEEHNLSA